MARLTDVSVAVQLVELRCEHQRRDRVEYRHRAVGIGHRIEDRPEYGVPADRDQRAATDVSERLLAAFVGLPNRGIPWASARTAAVIRAAPGCTRHLSDELAIEWRGLVKVLLAEREIGSGQRAGADLVTHGGHETPDVSRIIHARLLRWRQLTPPR